MKNEGRGDPNKKWWINEESKEETTRGGFSNSSSKSDDSPDAINGKYKSLDDAFADLDSL